MRPVRTHAQRRTLRPVVHQHRLAEARILPPGLQRILRLGTHDLRRVAAVTQVIEDLPVRRKDARALMRARLPLHQRRLADHRVHHIQVTTRREGNLRPVVAERDVSIGIVVPTGIVTTPLRLAALDVTGLRLEQDARRRDSRRRRIKPPEVELLTEDHRLAVCAQRRLEDVVVGEVRQLSLLARRKVVIPDVTDAAAGVQVVEALPVRTP